MSKQASPYIVDRDNCLKAMKNKGLSVPKIAKQLNVTARHFSRYLQENKPQHIPDDVLRKLANILDVPFESLVSPLSTCTAENLKKLEEENKRMKALVTIQEDRAAILGILLRHGCELPFSAADMENTLYDSYFEEYIGTIVNNLINQTQSLAKIHIAGQQFATFKTVKTQDEMFEQKIREKYKQ